MALLPVMAACGADGGARRPTLTVLAASSLTESFTELAHRYEAGHDVRVELDFESSSSIVRKLAAGAPADVVATADDTSMNAAVRAGAVAPGAPVTFARNRLELVVAAGNPKQIGKTADLGRAGVTFVICASEVPCGNLAERALHDAGVEPATAASREENVKAVMTRVVLGEADAGIVYATDVRAGGRRVTGIAVDPPVETTYLVAPVRRSPRAALARDLAAFVVSAEGRDVTVRFGFLPP